MDAELRKEVLDVLEELEWVQGKYHNTGPYCRLCENWEHQGHAPDCRLAALIKKLKECPTCGGTGKLRVAPTAKARE